MDREEIFCSTHLIMKGIKKPKKKIGQANSDMGDGKTFAENSSALQIDALESSSKSTAYVLDAPSSFEFGATPYRGNFLKYVFIQISTGFDIVETIVDMNFPSVPLF